MAPGHGGPERSAWIRHLADGRILVDRDTASALESMATPLTLSVEAIDISRLHPHRNQSTRSPSPARSSSPGSPGRARRRQSRAAIHSVESGHPRELWSQHGWCAGPASRMTWFDKGGPMVSTCFIGEGEPLLAREFALAAQCGSAASPRRGTPTSRPAPRRAAAV